MNAVILYNDFDYAGMAKAMLQRAAQRLGGGFRWRLKPWRVDLLSFLPGAETALAEARNAHLMVLALRPGQFLPAGLMKWLGKWAARRTWREAALAVISGRRNDPLSGPSIARLSRFARRQGLGFFFDYRKPGKDKLDASIINLREREIAITPTLQSILE